MPCLLAQTVGKFKYKVDGCFLWSTGSWDILAVYPESTTTEGSYFDPVVAQIIDGHNSVAREAGHAFIAPTRDKKSSVRKFKSGIGLRLRPVVSAGDGASSETTVKGGVSPSADLDSESSVRPVTTLYSSSGSPLTGSRSRGDSSHVRSKASSSADAAARETEGEERGRASFREASQAPP